MKKTRSLYQDVNAKVLLLLLLLLRLSCASRGGEILRDNGCRGNLKELDLEYLVILGHGVIDGIVVAWDSVVLLSHNVLADEQFLLCRAGLGKSSECGRKREQELREN